jgi:uncharacterized Ntn-hydrolase superfamily protein
VARERGPKTVQDALTPPRRDSSAARAFCEICADDAVEQSLDVEVVAKLSAVGGVVDFARQRGAVLHQKRTDQFGEGGVLVGKKGRAPGR